MPALALSCVLTLSAGTAAATVAPAPWTPVADLGPDGLQVAIDEAALAEVAGGSSVTLVDVALPGGASADLQLERVPIAADGARVVLDGETVPGLALDAGLSLWSGTVAGADGSEVFLALSASGSRGWIRTDDALVHLVARPDALAGWTTPDQRLVTDARLRELGVQSTWTCGLDEIEQPFADRVEAVASASAAADGELETLPILEAELAVETDTAYFELFGDLDAAQTYLVSLLGAVSARYKEQLGVVLTMPYLGLWSGDDPWTSPDVGGSTIDMLFEFQGAWDGGEAPERADIYHFVSGAPLGGGVAYLSTVCNQDFAFGVSANLAGLTPVPVVQGPLNWDFVVVAHELGHNFGTPHTHDFCPPLDQCAPEPFMGECQDEQVCLTDGTVMSYCHLCPGGIENVTTYFHPDVVATMRDYTAVTGLQPFTGLLQADLGQALAGATEPDLQAGFVAPRGVELSVEQAPPETTGMLVWSGSELSAPFKGGVLVPDTTLVIPMRTLTGTFEITARVPDDVALPEGGDYWLQLWFLDASGPEGFSSTNAVHVDLILSEPLPEPEWVAHPSNGLEYAISNPGTYFDAIEEAATYGGVPATIDSVELNDWLLGTFGDSGPFSVFIGYQDLEVEGTFVWESGAPAGFENWGPGEPDDGFDPSGENVAEFLFFDWFDIAAGEWNDWTEWGWFTNRTLLQRPVAEP